MPFQFFSSDEFFPHLTNAIEKATKRVYMQAMIVEFPASLSPLAEAIANAAKRQVEVEIHVDTYSKLYTEEHINILPVLSKEQKDFFAKTKEINKQAFDSFKKAGAKIIYTNPFFYPLSYLFPRVKRNHIKIIIVDDVAYVGGMNISDRSARKIDFMIRLQDPHVIQSLIKEFMSVHATQEKMDTKERITDDLEILIDSGKILHSLIYKEAIIAIGKAKKSIRLISQYLPNFALLEELHKANERGVIIDIITNDRHSDFGQMQSQFDAFRGYMVNHVEQFLLNYKGKHITISYFPHKDIHAKLLLIDDNTAFFGSHNFSHLTVLLGTRELAFKTTQADLVAYFANWYKTIKIQTKQ